MLAKLWRNYSYVIVLIILLFVFLFVMLNQMGDNKKYLEVKVQQGDSLWSLADDFSNQINMSKTDFIKWVGDRNNLISYSVKEGEVLKIPVEVKQASKSKIKSFDYELALED